MSFKGSFQLQQFHDSMKHHCRGRQEALTLVCSVSDLEHGSSGPCQQPAVSAPAFRAQDFHHSNTELQRSFSKGIS